MSEDQDIGALVREFAAEAKRLAEIERNLLEIEATTTTTRDDIPELVRLLVELANPRHDERAVSEVAKLMAYNGLDHAEIVEYLPVVIALSNRTQLTVSDAAKAVALTPELFNSDEGL